MTNETSFGDHAGGSPLAATSADMVVPMVLALTGARSVVDVGCGTGGWLRAFANHGVTDVLGIDNGPSAEMLIGAELYQQSDMRTGEIDPGRRFDLAVCLEVGEHLPADRGTWLVDSLTRMADVVLFSAAIPWQGGPSHVNEQWQSWWAERFRAHGYEAYDVIRPAVWGDERVAWWYQQNVLLYAKASPEGAEPARMLDLAHPEAFVMAQGVAAILRRFPSLVRGAISKRRRSLRR